MKYSPVELIQAARDAKEKAYVPYFKFHVGAALLGKDGKIYTGANIEGASFGVTVCAERTAFYKAITEGCNEFEAIAITSDSDKIIYPCGICRQVMSDFVGEDFTIICGSSGEDYEVTSFKDLFPHAIIPI